MFAIINRKDMTLVGHIRFKVEATRLPPLHFCISLEDEDFLKQFTHLEVKILYNNLGQIPRVNISDCKQVVEGVRKLIKYHPVKDISFQEGLFSVATSTHQHGTAAPAGAMGRDRTGADTVAPAPKAGGKAVIWNHADKVWEEAGKPTDKAVVLQLRKQMMTELEAVGVKRTSSSNELGIWMKTRIP